MTDAPPSIRSILSTLSDSDDKNIATVVAGTINLYTEAHRMLSGKRLLTAKDIRNIFDILSIVLTEPEAEFAKDEQIARRT